MSAADQRRTQLATMFNHHAPLAKLLGMRLASWGDDGASAVFELAPNPATHHAGGFVHGGVYCTLLDCAIWFTAALTDPDPNPNSSWWATSDLNVHFLRPAAGVLRAVGGIVKAGKRQTVAEGRLYDGEGHLVAHATGTCIKLTGVQMPLHGTGSPPRL